MWQQQTRAKQQATGLTIQWPFSCIGWWRWKAKTDLQTRTAVLEAGVQQKSTGNMQQSEF